MAGYNLAEMGRMLESAKVCKGKFGFVFFELWGAMKCSSTSTKPGANRKKSKSGGQNCHKLKLWKSEVTDENSFLSEAKKTP